VAGGGGGSSMGGGHKTFGSGLFGKDSQTTMDVYLNLTPLMDVMSNILFFLLSAFGATVVAIMPTTVPLESTSGETSIAAEDDKVTVSLRADATGYTVNAESGSMTPEQLKPYGARIPKKGVDYDHAALTAQLKKIKQAFPLSATMILVPDDDIKYETIVGIMDAAREVKMPDGGMLQLFPEVVLSSIYKGPAAGAAPGK
jgi:biopolymer transport protein ExbD